MKTLLPFLIALSVLPAGARAQQTGGALQTTDRRLRTARDSTMNTVSVVGEQVANVKAGTDLLRRLAFTDTNSTGAISQAGAALRQSCQAMSQAATTGRKTMCLHCMISQLQPSFNSYRDYLPSLAALGNRCAGLVRQSTLESGTPAERRRLALEVSNTVVTGLRLYEERLNGIMRALTAPGRPRAGQGGR